MRTFALLVIPALASAFGPSQLATFSRGGVSVNGIKEDYLDKTVDDIAAQTEKIIEKGDDLVLSKVVSVANHAPAAYTLKELGSAVGSSWFGVDAAGSAFSTGIATALAVPTFLDPLWKVMCFVQVASLAKSALADDNEISQADITKTAVANYALMKAITTGDLSWLLASSVASSYPNRSGASFKAGIHNISLQIMSSLTTLTATLAVITKLSSYVPFLDGKEELNTLLGILGFYSLSKRQGNTTIKKSINAAAAVGMLWARISSGALNISGLSSLLSLRTVSLLGTSVVAWMSFNKAKESVAL